MAAPKSLAARLTAQRRKIGKWVKSPAGRWTVHNFPPLATIFGVCAYISYGHVERYALMGGESATVARLLPVLYDALMFGAIPYMKARHPAARYAAFTAFGYGFTMSLIANIKASADTVDGKIIGVSVAVVLGLTAIMVHFGSKPAPKKKAPVKVPAKAPQSAVQTFTVDTPHTVSRTTARGVVAVAEPAYR